MEETNFCDLVTVTAPEPWHCELVSVRVPEPRPCELVTVTTPEPWPVSLWPSQCQNRDPVSLWPSQYRNRDPVSLWLSRRQNLDSASVKCCRIIINYKIKCMVEFFSMLESRDIQIARVNLIKENKSINLLFFYVPLPQVTSLNVTGVTVFCRWVHAPGSFCLPRCLAYRNIFVCEKKSKCYTRQRYDGTAMNSCLSVIDNF